MQLGVNGTVRIMEGLGAPLSFFFFFFPSKV